MKLIRRSTGTLLVSLGALGAVDGTRDFLTFEWMHRNAWASIENVAFCTVWALLIVIGLRLWRKPGGVRASN